MYVEVKIIHNMAVVFILNGRKILFPGIDHSWTPCSWKENDKEGIGTILKTPVSSVSGEKYYWFDDFVS